MEIFRVRLYIHVYNIYIYIYVKAQLVNFHLNGDFKRSSVIVKCSFENSYATAFFKLQKPEVSRTHERCKPLTVQVANEQPLTPVLGTASPRGDAICRQLL